MKVTISQEFVSVEEAAHWLESVMGGGRTINVLVPPPVVDVKDLDVKIRKPRSDAGKVRGPYKLNGEPATSEPTKLADSAAIKVAVPATPPTPAAQASTVPASSAKTPHAAPSAPTAAAPTPEDARAALKRMADTEGFGTPACIAHLKEFKVNRLSELKPESYALFIKQADDKVAAGE